MTTERSRTSGHQPRITERKQAEDERDRFLPVDWMLCSAASTAIFKRGNSAWQRTLGYTREEMVAEPLWRSCNPDDRSRPPRGKLKKTLLRRHHHHLRERYPRKGRLIAWMLWTATPVVDPQ